MDANGSGVMAEVLWYSGEGGINITAYRQGEAVRGKVWSEWYFGIRANY